MKKIALIIICIISIMAFAACGSSGKYPINIGDGYQDVYDYCMENSAGKVYTYDVTHMPISAQLDWFGDGDIYDAYITFDDEKVSEIYVSTKVESDYYEEDGAALIEKLKAIHGDPLGNANPDADDDVKWKDGNLIVDLDSSYDPDDDNYYIYKIDYYME